ncbi:putative 72,8 kDa protein in lys 3'region ORF27 [Erwinia piriflorinigrans CFBP 5888]|uniref:Putative 72,8 kDa protein in lys 3'region ORF27 n=1 Tax=Erwinia piriflorinigrans CFBP 5888 TaxID=1161919 RepID=V5ZAU3_9GAMM|nr:putative 72,8 kDa protein in lys 3'region ORF27 [Erwinia piriflorinigrans CFBP 5888]
MAMLRAGFSSIKASIVEMKSPMEIWRAGMSGIKTAIGMASNPMAMLRAEMSITGEVLSTLTSGPLALLRLALYGISGVLGFLLSPVGLLVAALVGAALLIWNYWEPIKAFLGGVVEGFSAAAAPISEALAPLQPIFDAIGNAVKGVWNWFTELLTPVKSSTEELQSAAEMGRNFGTLLAEGLNIVLHPLDSIRSGVRGLLESLGLVKKEAAEVKLPAQVLKQQQGAINNPGGWVAPADYGPFGQFSMYDSGGYIRAGQTGIVGENGPEIVNGPANITSRRRTAALASVVAGMMGVAAAPADAAPLHPLSLPAKAAAGQGSQTARAAPIVNISTHAPIAIYVQPGQNPQDIAQEVARQLAERERSARSQALSNLRDQEGYDI